MTLSERKHIKKGYSLFTRLANRTKKLTAYVTTGVWHDPRRTFGVNFLKTCNLSVRSFLNTDLQVHACALTYQTLLAIVPALALIFAIGRGFGFQNLLETQILEHVPAQQQALSTAFGFVDSYLSQYSEGMFVGVGILFLLWTLISLISNVENVFNKVWGVKNGRTLWRKLTDYTAICLILPVLLICSSGIMVTMSGALKALIPGAFNTPIIQVVGDLLSVMLVWLFFAGSYMLFPNTKVKFTNALMAGIMAGTGYVILQWLFVSGQIYVTRYNAIYGSFAFLPLLLIWLQLVWMITLSGAVVCFSSQNIFDYNFSDEVARISPDYRWTVTVAVMAIIISRFNKQKSPFTPHQIAVGYDLPITLVSEAAHKLEEANLVYRVSLETNHEGEYALAPALDTDKITLGTLTQRLGHIGSQNFIPRFNQRFTNLIASVEKVREAIVKIGDDVQLSQFDFPEVNSIAETFRV